MFARLRGLFRERQIYLRSEGEVEFVTLRPSVQIISLLIMMGGLFWLVFATINITFKDQLLSLKERRMYQTRLDYEDRIAAMRARLDKLNTKLMIDQDQYLSKVDEVRAEYERLVERQKQLSEFFRKDWGLEKPKTGAVNFPTVSAPIPAQPAPRIISPKEGNARGSLNDLPAKKLPTQRFATKAAVLVPLEALRQQFTGLEALQVSLLDDYVSLSRKRVEKAGKILARFGISGLKLAKQSSYVPERSIGGPFVSLTAAELGSQRIADRLSLAVQNFSIVEKIRHESVKLPLALPMRKIKRISSRFGLRRDPFRRSAAMHSGVDFKGAYGATILATAEGVVIKAGWEGAYGRLVTIRHLGGITTRYAHMSKVLVKPGQQVKKGTPVGRLGNTGRSTGPHLHYETRVHGRAVNPVRFWKARNALQKLSQR